MACLACVRRRLQRSAPHARGISATNLPGYAYYKVDKSYSTGWLGRLLALPYCLHWVKELRTAATITVTTNNPNVIADGQCSLIEAIWNANNDAATFPDCASGSGADTIVLPASANLTLSALDNTTLGPTGLPVITSRITIEGNGATIARQVKALSFSLMVVKESGDLTLHHLTLSGSTYSGLRNYGTASIKDSVISGNESGVFNRGTLTIENSSISANAGRVLLLPWRRRNEFGNSHHGNSTISGNSSRYGGGVVNHDTLTIVNSTISGNKGHFQWRRRNELFGNSHH